MVFENNLINVTMSPGAAPLPTLYKATAVQATFEQAAAANHIYKGNGAICQKKMCAALTGCESNFGCPDHAEWKRVVDFCGPAGTPAVYDKGSFWVKAPADTPALRSAAMAQLGLQQFPTPYSLQGMYP